MKQTELKRLVLLDRHISYSAVCKQWYNCSLHSIEN